MKYIFGNQKMYLDAAESLVLADKLSVSTFDTEKVAVAVFPNFLSITGFVEKLHNTKFAVGGQNSAWVPKGAYTGAVSALLLKEAGCEYVLVGHSERRHIFGETDIAVRKKLEAAIDAGLTPVLCIGETKEDRGEGKTQYRLKKQILSAIQGLDLVEKKLIIAYEPVWAISKDGVGVPCSPADAEDVHGWLEQELKNYVDEKIPIIYGGSVDCDNVVSYLSQETISGVLVGSTSRKIDTFLPLIRAAEQI